MSDRLDWLPLYTQDWLRSRGVRRLKREARSMYLDILCEIWEKGPIADDATEVAMLIGENPDYFAAYWPGIRALLIPASGGGLTQERLAEEHAKAIVLVEKAAAKGKKGAEALHKKRSGLGIAPAIAQAEPQPGPGQQLGHAPLTSYLSLSPARARVKDELASRGILTPDGVLMDEVSKRVEAYAEKSATPPEEVATSAFEAFDKIAATWPVKRITSALFAKHWEAIQQVMAGADPTPRQNSRAPPEPKQRTYEDLGTIADRIEGKA